MPGTCMRTTHWAWGSNTVGRSTSASMQLFHSGSRPMSVSRSYTSAGGASTWAVTVAWRSMSLRLLGPVGDEDAVDGVGRMRVDGNLAEAGVGEQLQRLLLA